MSGAQWRGSARVLALLAVGLLTGCAPQPEATQAELFPETQQPYFKTCIAKVEGTYRERELQQHYLLENKCAPPQWPLPVKHAKK